MEENITAGVGDGVVSEIVNQEVNINMSAEENVGANVEIQTEDAWITAIISRNRAMKNAVIDVGDVDYSDSAGAGIAHMNVVVLIAKIIANGEIDAKEV